MVTLNNKQQLYVIPAGKGFSCLGFEVLYKRATALAAELNTPFHSEIGTMNAYNDYMELIETTRQRYIKNGIRSKTQLSPQLIGLEGKRVEVVDNNETKPRRFIVGKSTGFIPCHLEISRKNSSGGSAASDSYKSIKVIH